VFFLQYNSVLEAVAHYAADTPDKIILIDADTNRHITYGDFWRHVCVFAKRLKDMGLYKGDRVVVRVGPMIETFVAQFGIYLAGGVYCPVEKHLKKIKLLELLDYYDSMILISSEKIENRGTFIDLITILDNCEPLTNYSFPNPDDLCMIIFSTGTTGKAKGIMRSFRISYKISLALIKLYSFTAADVFMWITSFDRMASMTSAYAILTAGGTAVHQNGIVFIRDFINNLKKFAVSALFTQSFAVVFLLNAAPEALAECAAQLRIYPISGGVLAEVHKNKLGTIIKQLHESGNFSLARQ
jgi:acyl-coenzyme A synthetase/AMP-(fatty) acid ligase